jgi:predicted metal-dependent phosphoesterase TrpH
MIKAACHIHSDWSYDGKWPLAKLASEFGRRGYRALLMTEHDRGFTPARLIEYHAACAAVSSEKILVVPGIEYSDASNTIHVLTWGTNTVLGEALPTSELLKKVELAGGVAVLAHPDRKAAWKQFDSHWVANLLGIEVWNRKTDGWAPSRNAPPLFAGTSLLPFVGMDFHTRRQLFPLAMELEVQGLVTESSVLESLRSRHCRPTALGRPVEEFLPSSWRRSGLRAAEFGRRTAALALRKLRPRAKIAA